MSTCFPQTIFPPETLADGFDPPPQATAANRQRSSNVDVLALICPPLTARSLGTPQSAGQHSCDLPPQSPTPKALESYSPPARGHPRSSSTFQSEAARPASPYVQCLPIC